MSAQSPDPPIAADTVPGRRDALTASPSPAMPAATSPTGGKLPLSATERTRHRRYRHLGGPTGRRCMRCSTPGWSPTSE